MDSKIDVPLGDGVLHVDLFRGGRLRNVTTPDACKSASRLLTDAIVDDTGGLQRLWTRACGEPASCAEQR